MTMRILVHAPFGTSSEESGLLYLLVKYLHRYAYEMVQLRCGGTFATCDRDAATLWKRELATCFRCIQNQRELAQWSEISATDLSTNLRPEDLLATRKWISQASTESLLSLPYESIHPYPLVKGSFALRFLGEEPNLANRHHEQVLRRLLLSAVRTRIATRRLFSHSSFQLAFIVKPDNFIASSVLSGCEEAQIPSAICKWDPQTRVVQVYHPQRAEQFTCSLVLNGLPTMRADIKTWPPEVMSIIHELVAFLGLGAESVSVAQ